MIDAAAPRWRKSSTCNSGYCVEVAPMREAVWMRDSKQPEAGLLSFEAATWSAFLQDVKAGSFDLG
jgi:hypothetical protein